MKLMPGDREYRRIAQKRTAQLHGAFHKGGKLAAAKELGRMRNDCETLPEAKQRRVQQHIDQQVVEENRVLDDARARQQHTRRVHTGWSQKKSD